MNLAGARPKGPRPDLEDGPQKILLTRLNELNNPYRVSYEMVSRQFWSDQGTAKIKRSRTRDLSRQFRGEKAIEWRVVEIYVNLLFTAADPAPAAELAYLRELHTQAFGTTVNPDGTPSPEPTAAPAALVDPAHVAELERQLEEARTRAAFATALLVIVQAENTALRGRGSAFDWFSPVPRAGDTAAEAAETGSGPRIGRRAAGASAASSTPRAGRREPAPRSDTDPSQPVDPATTPIVRLQSYRAGQRRRPGSTRSALADAFPLSGRAPASPAAAPPSPSALATFPAPVPSPAPAPSSALATSPPVTVFARDRSASASPRRAPASDPPADDSGLDILVGREKRRRRKNG
ncbi:hypothetical protein I6A84_02660 [Frankia sp. CNm7]|uniref:Uncharacterized protein n=1 Tax=Frankia nepalensis TaxID=1836974 RepID=A0A937RGA2_9ACTN|nr:hypothetical protein [Frankia nepalensis]MBL7499083.1 hypothetical protein [Frankia nepalensis]MBL7511429.1 hypothetical protein [Frankia nepalensis]MBL7517056.1 hypothetical protein [Frankia nepalensis]MBL7629532.1 hypothetical protein [Frankia nepalensis]